MPDIDTLSGVKSHKATGPDEVLARLLNEAADQLALIFWAFYRQSTGPCRIANSKRSPNLQECWPRIFCKLHTSVSDVNLLQGYGTHHHIKLAHTTDYSTWSHPLYSRLPAISARPMTRSSRDTVSRGPCVGNNNHCGPSNQPCT